MIDFFQLFEKSWPYNEFLTQFGTPDQASNWERVRAEVTLTEQQKALLGSFNREINVLCMAGTWCGDCVQQCPILDVFAQESSAICLRFRDRDEVPELREELKICGGSRVPQVVFMSEEGAVVGRFGDRTLSRYRSMATSQFGSSFVTGGGDQGGFSSSDVVQDWLNEFERMHLILRLSPRLRQIHQD